MLTATPKTTQKAQQKEKAEKAARQPKAGAKADASANNAGSAGSAGFSAGLIAVIRIRGGVRISPHIEYAMELLGLKTKNCCVVRNDSPSLRGTLNKIKDYVTWGTLDAETYKLLKEKVKNCVKENQFRLSPPLKGFGRKGTKVSFNKSGSLGNRKEKINELIKKMIH